VILKKGEWYQSKNGVVAEYSLDGIKKPMAISEFALKEVLPDPKVFKSRCISDR
jgi:hypothetical protein